MSKEMLKYAYTDTPLPSLEWQRLSDAERHTRIVDTIRSGLADFNNIVVIVAKEDGQIIVNLVEPLPASKRGTLLLDLEAFLKDATDPGLVIWLTPLGDRNSLRNLRGIEVKL